MKIDLQPFQTPNFVLEAVPPGKRQDGFTKVSSFPLSRLEPQELSDMCDVFRATCFKKAGLTDPREATQVPPDKKVRG